MSIKIIVATHKIYDFPSDDMYIPLHVGKKNKPDLGYQGDDTGDNISLKNPYYCELTAMYWAWKNLKSEYLGIAHYRRHFCNRFIFMGSTIQKRNSILTTNKAEKILKEFDVILPKKRNYLLETNISHYAHAHNINDLIQTRKIINRKYPNYTECFDQIMKKRSGHRFNMFIMKKDVFDKYSEWLFDILFQLENDIDISNYSQNEARVFGYISERLLDVWLEVNSIKYTELPVMFMENQNWFKKGYLFLKRKVVAK